MVQSLEFVLERLQKADRLDQLQEIAALVRDHYGIDHCVYHWVSADGQQYGCGTYSREWCIRYVVEDYLRIDPVIIGCYQRFHPVDWKRLDWTGKAARAFQSDSLSHGVGNQGYSIPIRGPNGQFALFSLSHSTDDDSWFEFTQKHQRDMILIAHFFNQKALELAGKRAPEAAKSLSPRETDALTFLAMGYGRGQVAEMLSISEHTLRAYIESARFKLGAANTTHAVAKAVSDGIVVTGGAARSAQGGWPGLEEADVDRKASVR
ncbi:LuxR family transcriptional regulator [Pelagovum pacificum]|uniref:LuxR family transcriptional regulator n=2 Tax=Pelagovum pacificum TaxID=2588711 RepID=A0A5C5GC07_9RHOB|nr:LuxR family transcriptional regulator [Pelagovum pacificum]QQA42429.1 LuxR family transcriptional regulator [Pelagovum pacificum]TNY31512.1 LuxR family transcriptional regulator [Pelagovum pacificum]